MNSLVNDVIMPPIGMLLRGVDFANIFLLLKRGKKMTITKTRYKSLSQAKEDGAVTINVGVFLNSMINFFVISVIIFVIMRTITRIKRKKHSKSGKECKFCFSRVDIRAIKCPYCTSMIESEVPSEENSVSDEESTQASASASNTPVSTSGLERKRNLSKEFDSKDQDDESSDEDTGIKHKQYKYWKKNFKKQISRTVLE